MIYAEAAYFDGNHCAHVAAYEDNRRLSRLREAARRNRRPSYFSLKETWHV